MRRRSGFGALYRHELLQLKRSPLAWGLLGGMALLGGFYFSVDLLQYHAILALELNFLASLLFIVIPILTMRTFAGERQAGTDVLLMTAPISRRSIVGGKYAALAVLFAAMTLTTLPHVLSTLLLGGRVDALTGLSYLMFVLLGLAYIAIGMLVSALSAGQTVAALAAMLVFLAFNLLHTVSAAIGQFAARLLGWLDVFGWLSASARSAVADRISAGLTAFNPLAGVKQVSEGLLDWRHVFGLLTLTLLCLWLCERVLDWRRFSAGRLNALIRRRKRIVSMQIWGAVCLFAAANLLLPVLVGNSTQVDVTPNQVMTTGTVTRGLLAGLDEPVAIHVLDTKVNFTASNAFAAALIEDYRRQSSGRISVNYLDIQQEPQAVRALDPDDQYGLRTGQVVVTAGRSGRLRVLKQSDLIQAEWDGNRGRYVQTGFNAETALSGAIRFVTADQVPVIYLTTDQGEADIGGQYQTFRSVLQSNQFELKPLHLITEAVPSDAAAVVMLAPAQDLSEPAAAHLEDYIQRGGSLFVAAADNGGRYERLNEVLRQFDLKLSDRRIVEETASLIFQAQPTRFLAQLPVSRISEQAYPNSILVFDSRAVETAGAPAEWIGTEGVIVTDAQARLTASSSTSESDTDVLPGVRQVAALSENSGVVTGSEMPSAKAIVLGSSAVIRDDVLHILGDTGYNYSFIYHAMRWLSNQRSEAGRLMIQNKSVLNYSLGITRPGAVTAVTVLCAVVLPLLFWLAGWLIHRNRRRL